jgi:CBS domain-containing protein
LALARRRDSRWLAYARAVAAIDPIAYLRATPPFDALPEALFEAASAGTEIGFYPAGSRLAAAGGAPLQHLYVIRRGSVRLERGGQTVQVLEEGETFGYTSLLTHTASLDVVVEEDLLAYRIPADAFELLLQDAQFASHFATGLAERLKSSLQHSPVATFQPNLAVPVADLVRRPAVWIDRDATVADAAAVMRAERISSVLVHGDPPAIVTDRDFRNRVLAAGLGPDTPVAQVATAELCAVDEDTPVYDAWTALLDARAHHLVVKRGDGIVAVLTSTDLLRVTASGPVAVLRRVERLESRGSLPGYGKHVVEMSSALLSAGLDVVVIAGFVARLNDALVGRALGWVEAELGPAPAPYAWLAFGIEGRMEQTLLTDRENALVYSDDGAGHRAWFQSLADRVNDDLDAAGFPEGSAGRTARAWHGTVSEWTRRIEEALQAHAHDAGVYFDLRRVAGALDLAPIEDLLAAANERRVALRTLAKAALGFSPPVTLVVRVRARAVNLRKHGLLPVALLARCYAVELGSRARGTLDRIEAARAGGLIGDQAAATISTAFRFLLELELRTHLRQLSAGGPLSDELGLSALSAMERNRLKDALRAIRRWQEKAAYRYQVDLV